MSVLRVIKYPILYGFKDFGAACRDSKQMARFYDIAKRTLKGLRFNGKSSIHYKTFGNRLAEEIASRNISLDRSSLVGKKEDILEAVAAALPAYIQPGPDKAALNEILVSQGVIAGQGRKTRNFFPIKRARALSEILGKREIEQGKILFDRGRYEQLKSLSENKLLQMHAELDRLHLGHEAYQEIMNAVYKSDPLKDLTENIIEMLGVITRWAWQVIGRSPRSEAAGWLAVNPDGNIGIKYKYLRLEKGAELGKAEVFTLKKSSASGQISISETETTDLVSDKRGNFITTAEWENFNVSDTYVAVEETDGRRVLYRRTYMPGSQLVGQALRDKGKSLTAAFAQGAVALIGRLKNFDNAAVALNEVLPAEIELEKGELVPFLKEGSSIKLVAAGSADPNLRQTKIEKGLNAQNLLGVGIVEQPLDRSVGNVRASALKPMASMISDVDNFHVRPQNRFLISIVGVHSYFIRSLIEFDSEGNAVCLGSLEVTNPEVIPAKLNTADRKILIEQFEMGKIFAGLASTGIMIKMLREEIDRLTEQYVGPQIFKLIRSRDYQTLKGKSVDNATVMFADISGFTALSDILQSLPEKVVALLSRVFRELTPIVIRNGGMIDKYIGDAIMADWGVTETSKNDVENALRTAVEFQTRLQALNLLPEMQVFYEERGIPPLGMSIGLNTGKLIAGNIGHAGSKIEFSVIGDAVNVASRVQHAAVKGEIVIGARTYQLLSEDFKAEYVRNFNAYNRDIESLRKYILSQHQKKGKTIDQAALDTLLKKYLAIYRDATEEDLFAVGGTWAKNKGPVVYYQVKWDRNSWRNKFLLELGLDLRSEQSIAAPVVLSEGQREAAIQKAVEVHLAEIAAKKK